jgi:hypothetical protein
MGGLVGYQLKSLQLIIGNTQEDTGAGSSSGSGSSGEANNAAGSSLDVSSSSSSSGSSEEGSGFDGPAAARFHVPPALDLAGEGGRRVGARAAAQGIMSLPFMAEILPVGGGPKAVTGALTRAWLRDLSTPVQPSSRSPGGRSRAGLALSTQNGAGAGPRPPPPGAGDRLGLKDEVTGESLPAAMLPYTGRPMIELLVRDLQVGAREGYTCNGRGQPGSVGAVARRPRVRLSRLPILNPLPTTRPPHRDPRLPRPHPNLSHPPPPAQAREYLYWQLTGRQVTTPLAVMTSDAKGNHARITRVMERNGWFGRDPASFKLFRWGGGLGAGMGRCGVGVERGAALGRRPRAWALWRVRCLTRRPAAPPTPSPHRQPLVPVISSEDGKWLMTAPLKVR